MKLKEINNHMNFHVKVLVHHLFYLVNICLGLSVHEYTHRWYDQHIPIRSSHLFLTLHVKEEHGDHVAPLKD